MDRFRPLFRDPHAQTIGGAFWPREDLSAWPVTATRYRTEPHVEVLVHSQSPATPCGALLLVHGLEGSSEAGYMRSAAQAALTAGFAVHRMNIRGCGGTEALSNTLYHAGLTSDLRFVAERLRDQAGAPVYLGGFSLGGNQVLKLAGELGRNAHGLIAAAACVSVPIDLRACSIALNHRRNWLYGNRFVRNMAARLRRRHALMPDRFRLDALDGIRTVYEFDDRITAPFFGFGDAERYYGTQSSRLFLDEIVVPTLMIHSKDDPMIPPEVYDHPAFRRNPAIRLLLEDHGGHVAFLARNRPRFWAAHTMAAWLSQVREQDRAKTRPLIEQ